MKLIIKNSDNSINGIKCLPDAMELVNDTPKHYTKPTSLQMRIKGLPEQLNIKGGLK